MTCECFDSSNQVHARGYAPLVGVPEDPFTGSMQGELAACPVANNMVEPDLHMLGSEQGYFIGRPGKVHIEIVVRKPEVKACMYAHAMHVFDTAPTLP